MPALFVEKTSLDRIKQIYAPLNNYKKTGRHMMSCYFRHMKSIFEEAGIEVTMENKKDIDRIIHGLVEVEYKNCSIAWKAVKGQIKGDDKARSRFIKRLKRGMKEQ